MMMPVYVFLSIGSVLAVAWLLLLLIGSRKYENLVSPLSMSEHPMKIIYPVGFLVLNAVRYQYNSAFDRIRINQCRVLYGARYAEYYYRVNCAAKVSIVLTAFMLCPILYPFIRSSAVLLAGVVVAVVGFLVIDDMITDAYKKHEMTIVSGFPEVVSKLALLINAGMIMKEAWMKVSSTGQGLLYDEMRKTLDDIDNGTSEIDAYTQFGSRCSAIRVKKFSSMLVQNLKKGNREMVAFLKQMSKESWEEKKHGSKQQGEKANSKLLLPIGLMFLGILALILIPMASTFNVF